MASTSASFEPTTLPATNAETSLTTAHGAALSLAAVTGIIHLYLYTTEDWLPFLLAGAGFLGAIGLFFALKRYRRHVYVAGILFTAAQIAGYLLFPLGPLWLGVLDKVVQVALVVALGYLFVVDGARPPAVAAGPTSNDAEPVESDPAARV